MVVGLMAATLESSPDASSQIRRFGERFGRKIAVSVSSSILAYDGSEAMIELL